MSFCPLAQPSSKKALPLLSLHLKPHHFFYLLLPLHCNVFGRGIGSGAKSSSNFQVFKIFHRAGSKRQSWERGWMGTGLCSWMARTKDALWPPSPWAAQSCFPVTSLHRCPITVISTRYLTNVYWDASDWRTHSADRNCLYSGMHDFQISSTLFSP